MKMDFNFYDEFSLSNIKELKQLPDLSIAYGFDISKQCYIDELKNYNRKFRKAKKEDLLSFLETINEDFTKYYIRREFYFHVLDSFSIYSNSNNFYALLKYKNYYVDFQDDKVYIFKNRKLIETDIVISEKDYDEIDSFSIFYNRDYYEDIKHRRTELKQMSPKEFETETASYALSECGLYDIDEILNWLMENLEDDEMINEFSEFLKTKDFYSEYENWKKLCEEAKKWKEHLI